MIKSCYGGKHSACRGSGLNSPVVSVNSAFVNFTGKVVPDGNFSLIYWCYCVKGANAE